MPRKPSEEPTVAEPTPAAEPAPELGQTEADNYARLHTEPESEE